MSRLNSIKMKPSDTLRSYTQRVHQLVGKLSTPPPANLQMEWFISGLPELLDFEVRKADPQTLNAAIETAKRYEKSALLSGRWTEKKHKKKVTFEDEDDSDDYTVEEVKTPHPGSLRGQQSQLTKVVKDEFQVLKAALDEVKVQMAEIKKGRKPAPMSRTNVWCTRCKKEGHFAHDCQADWRMIMEGEIPPHEAERLEMETLYAIQQGAMRSDQRNRQGGSSRIPGTCWECGEVGHYSPACPNRKVGEYILLCGNCREEGHKASMCQKPVQVRIQPRYVPTLPREQTALNWGNKTAVEQQGEEPASNVRRMEDYENVRRIEEYVMGVATRRKSYDRSERDVIREEPESDDEAGPEPGDEPVPEPVLTREQSRDSGYVLPDVTEEVLEHLATLQEEEGRTGSRKTTVVVQPSLSRSARMELHYNIMQDVRPLKWHTRPP